MNIFRDCLAVELVLSEEMTRVIRPKSLPLETAAAMAAIDSAGEESSEVIMVERSLVIRHVVRTAIDGAVASSRAASSDLPLRG